MRYNLWISLLFFAFSALWAGAQPTLKTKVGHLCCGGCASSVTSSLQKVKGVRKVNASVADRSVEITLAEGQAIDLAGIIDAMRKAGFATSEALLTGAKGDLVVEVGHLCCGGCASAAQSALAKVPNIAKSSVQQSQRKLVITPKADTPFNLVVLYQTLWNAGFPPLTITLSG